MKKLEKESYVKNLIQKGAVLHIHQQSIIDKIVKKYRTERQTINGINYRIIYRNTTSYVNEVANYLVKNKNCDFAVCYHYDDKMNITRFNLRSIDSKADVSEVAKQFGGGGHRNASGLTLQGFKNKLFK